MGIGNFFKKTFGKQVCAFCGKEVGMMSRTKIRNDEFICDDCASRCSRFISLYRFNKEDLQGHMEYMERQGKLVALLGTPPRVVPLGASHDAVEFFDDAGMFRIRNLDADKKKAKEMFRYDQVLKYEPYCKERDAEEPGKPKIFEECGLIITLVGAENMDRDDSLERKGLQAHPYITEKITVCINKREKKIGTLDLNQIVSHFDYIFGVHDNTKGLFDFGPTKQQKREGEALKAMGGMFAAAMKAAKTGEVSEEVKAQADDAMKKVSDAASGGLAEYSRRADATEAKIQ